MAEVLIVESISKRFKVNRNRPVTLKELIIRKLKGGNDNTATTFWALQEVSFSVSQGRTLGIIGHNGAGKSTLLRLVCGLGRPTKGKIHRIGHMGSLLELGNGFNPEMSGRENLITGGILSGLTKRQVKDIQDEIIAFAELEEFVDQPVRTYSTGMYLRLAFAAAIQFDPDFLIVDEVLAVGDSRFQEKCQKRLKALRAAGKSLILVSHDLDQVRSLCDEVLVLEEGRVVIQGEPEKAINCYHDLMRQRTENRAAQLGTEAHRFSLLEQGHRMGTQEATISGVSFFDQDNKTVDCLSDSSSLTIEVDYLLRNALPDLALLLGIYTETNMKCFETYLPSTREVFGPLARKGLFRCHLPQLPLLPGRYYFNVGLWPTDWSYALDHHWQMHSLTIRNEKESPPHTTGVVSIRPTWSSRFLD
jgi:lipopolysaccharide transport system ATP-binding protein